jgi:hypothetical protein
MESRHVMGGVGPRYHVTSDDVCGDVIGVKKPRGVCVVVGLNPGCDGSRLGDARFR